MKETLQRLVLLIVPAVVALVLGSIHGTYIGHYDFWHSSRLFPTIFFATALVASCYSFGLPDESGTRGSAALAAAGAVFTAVIAVSLVQLASGSPLLPRFVVFWTAAFTIPWGALSAAVSGDLSGRSATLEPVVVVGTEADVERLRVELGRQPERPASIAQGLTLEQARSSLVDVVQSTGARVVILDRLAQDDDQVVAGAATLHVDGIRIRTLSLFYEQWLGKLPLSELERVSLMFDIGQVHRRLYGRQKRIIDVIFGLLLAVAFLGLIPVVAVCDLFMNRGSLLFRQVRVGRNGKHFVMLKFRTMSDSSDAQWTTVDDTRLNGFGRFLRRVHIDEIPQAWNLLRGDLSIVGPRPEQPQYVEELTTQIPFYDFRHIVRPGLTGWAQVKHSYGSNLDDVREKLQYDFFYLRRQGVMLDFRVIARTTRSVLLQRGR